MGKSKYDDLIKHLRERNEEEIELDYSKIEEILKRPLSRSTKNGGITKKSSLVKAVMKADYIVSNNSYKYEVISLRRDPEEAKRRIDQTKVENSDIFLNVIFPHGAGYLKGENNIGHEVIDLFTDDNGGCHYYLNPDGLVDKDNVPKAILSISQVSTGLFKVLNKAVGFKVAKHAQRGGDETSKRADKQKEKYKYNDRSIEEYFSSNSGDTEVYVSYNCEGIYDPLKPIYIVFPSAKNAISNDQARFCRLTSTSTGRATCFKNFSESDKKNLEKLVKDDGLWKKEPVCSFEDFVKEYKKQPDSFSYFKELGIEYSELQYSNAIRFFLRELNASKEFLNILGCDVGEDESFDVERERYSIDLFFSNFKTNVGHSDLSSEKMIIVENKIKAGITPSDDGKTLDEHVKKIFMHVYGLNEDKKLDEPDNKKRLEDIKRFLRIDEAGGQVPSQLSKYYIYAVILAKKRGWKEKQIESNIRCFLLCPDYSKFLYGFDKDGHLSGNTFINDSRLLFLQEKYRLCTYSKILPFFEKEEKDSCEEIRPFLKDFIVSLKVQASDRDDTMERSMIERFYSRSIG